jgi:hypothetical protein
MKIHDLTRSSQVLTISTDFTCTAPASVNPISTDYILQGTTSTGAQAGEVFLARRNKTANIDTFTVKVSAASSKRLVSDQCKLTSVLQVPLYPKYSTTASFSVYAKVLYPITDSDGKQVLVTAGQLSPVSFA